MKKIGIIAEFNPFHNGHVYFLKQVKKLYPNCFITVILTTNFSERGEISILSKWDKTRICLKYGVDLVIELPVFFATNGADIFSENAIKLLRALNIDYLVFGSETNDIEILKNLANTIVYHKDYNELLKKYLSLGNSYPSSVSKALYNLTHIKLINSNDILGVSYIKTIIEHDYNIEPISIKRTNNYLDRNLSGTISSATSIRESYFNNQDVSKYIPVETNKYLTVSKDIMNNYFYILKYKIISDIDNLDSYLDVKKEILNSNNYQELLESLKSKRYTYNKLNRMFLHILLNIKKDDKYNLDYIRVLGFSKKGRKYLKDNKDEFFYPIVTNYKDTENKSLKLELRSTILYSHIIKNEELIKEELKSVPIQID